MQAFCYQRRDVNSAAVMHQPLRRKAERVESPACHWLLKHCCPASSAETCLLSLQEPDLSVSALISLFVPKVTSREVTLKVHFQCSADSSNDFQPRPSSSLLSATRDKAHNWRCQSLRLPSCSHLDPLTELLQMTVHDLNQSCC